MLAKRIIACLDVKDGSVVKGVSFEELRYSGDPILLAKLYSKLLVDELVFLDVTASVEKRKIIAELVSKIAEQLDIPFTVGGGINSYEIAAELITNGADKVSINTAAIENPDLITKIANKFGRQAVVVAVDVKRYSGEFIVFSHSGKKNTGIRLKDWLVEVQERGAGEVLLTSIDRDGTKFGYDLEMLILARDVLDIPIIASGGAGDFAHFLEVFNIGIDAALAASIFHYGEISPIKLKEYLYENGVCVRL
ncbi:imidazole glycerol phosphate synthase subunit HisF [Fervidobacterium sp.]